ncbi:hypothetical protein Ddc_08360 [Ditylenchus destructor]|nr:hypothetical protein Ddc_08360 [Ditylenchus destructor]
MGRREKHVQEEAQSKDVAGASHADDQTYDYEEKRERKKHKKAKKNRQETAEETPSSSVNCSELVNGDIQQSTEQTPVVLNDGGQEDDGSYSLWLIRKPIDVSVEELKKLSFPKKKKMAVKNPKKYLYIEGSSGEMDTLECRFEKPQKQMFYVNAKNANTVKELSKMKQGGEIEGILWIDRSQVPDDGLANVSVDPGANNACYNEEPSTSAEMPFVVHSIRQKPDANSDSLKERLQAFGTTSEAEEEAFEPPPKKHKRSKLE